MTKWAAASVLALLLFGRQIASWTNARNRYLFHWQAGDGIALALAVVILGVTLFVAGSALARVPWVRAHRLHQRAFVLALVAALLSQVSALSSRHSFWIGLALWALVLSAFAWAWKRWDRKLVRGALAACMVMFPLVPLLLVQMLWWPSFDVRSASSLAPAPAESGRTPVFLLVFDEWSAPRSQDGAQFQPFLPHLNALAGQSLVVRNALSPGYTTRISLPRLLFQRDGDVEVRGGRITWIEGGARTPTQQVPSLFDAARALGYRTRLLGYYLPYRALLGEEVDSVHSEVHVPKAKSLAGKLGLFFAGNLQHYTDPLSQLAWPRLDARLYSEHWRGVNLRLRADLAREIETASDNTLLFAHLPMPHAPFVFDEDGSYRRPFEGERMEGSPEDYTRALRYADTVLGETVELLERLGKFDRALLIVTSDHSWKKEPDPSRRSLPNAAHRVPLLIKWPSQREGLTVEDSFCTARLLPVIDAALAGLDAQASPADLWRTLGHEGRESDWCIAAAREKASGS